MKYTRMLSIMTILIVISYRGFALNEQKIPALPDAPGISAFLIKPSQGMAKMPAGWKRNTDRNFSNSQLALEYLTAVQGAAPYKTISETLPKAHYTMFILAIGKGRARVGGGDWKEINVAGNYYQWVKLGKSKKKPTGDGRSEVTIARFQVCRTACGWRPSTHHFGGACHEKTAPG
jgi:hypothetical protein